MRKKEESTSSLEDREETRVMSEKSFKCSDFTNVTLQNESERQSPFIFAIPHLEKSFINPKLTIFSLKSEVILLPLWPLNCSVMSYRRNCSCSSCPLNALLTSALKTNSSLIVEMTDPLQASILWIKYSAQGRWELSHCSHIYLPVPRFATRYTKQGRVCEVS